MFYVYKFENVEGKVIYVGRTDNLSRRLHHHFTRNHSQSHLPDACYDEVRHIKYTEVDTYSRSNILELQLIDCYRPKYNNRSLHGDERSLDMEIPVCKWQEYPLSDLHDKESNHVNQKRNLTNARIKLGYSQREVAKILDINQGVYSRFEAGIIQNTNIENLIRLRDFFKMSIDAILDLPEL